MSLIEVGAKCYRNELDIKIVLPYATFHVRHKDNSHFILNTYVNLMHPRVDLPCTNTVLDNCDGHKIGHSIVMIDCS